MDADPITCVAVPRVVAVAVSWIRACRLMHLAMNMFVLYELAERCRRTSVSGWAGLPGLYIFSLICGSLPALFKH